eukprot:10537272-Alexandrium_andersonii.AAC.1
MRGRRPVGPRQGPRWRAGDSGAGDGVRRSGWRVTEFWHVGLNDGRRGVCEGRLREQCARG